MPIYEYFCEKCKQTIETLQKINDPVPIECSSCHETYCLKKAVSSNSFQLKGSGWYKDLYSSPKKDTKESK